ncbi:MBG domain-containing protein [Blautia wexlerae]|uniref:MBG domain-containing protein n=2 Tax=Blautia wexlerae TaxID=418240 RepID=UPI0021F86007|nr:MBG domain-containing protein [Blautia wexlerae]UWO18947.1 hypothetical protein NQ550_11710 [Blautia wexlerae DSM 19850]
MRKKLLAGVMALALCSTNMPPQTIFAQEFTSGNPEEVSEVFTDTNQESAEEELSVFASESVPEFSSETNIAPATTDVTESTIDIDLTDPTNSEYYDAETGRLEIDKINGGGSYRFKGSGNINSPTTVPIRIRTSRETNIYLNNVYIVADLVPALDIQTYNIVNIYLENNNFLETQNSNSYESALKMEFSLPTIYSQNNSGSLTVSSTSGTGIRIGSGSLTIKGGSVTASSSSGTGIDIGSGSLTIKGGSVTASSTSGTGIKSKSLTIEDGSVKASSTLGTGIESGSLTINGGSVTASSANETEKGISSNQITINGGSVKASSVSSSPKNTQGDDVYCCTIENPKSEAVIIDRNPTSWEPKNHQAVDPLYAWLTGETHTISVGNTTQTYYFDKNNNNNEFKPITNRNFTFTKPSNLTYDGTAQKAPLKCNIEDIKDEIKLSYYNKDDGQQSDEAINAGTYTVTANIAGNIFADESWTFTIKPRNLNISINDIERKYGENNPELTYLISPNTSLVANDTTDILGITLTTTANKDTAANTTWPITMYYTTKNYTINATPGKLTIKPATFNENSIKITAYSGTYDGSEHPVINDVSVYPDDSKVEYSTETGTPNWNTTCPKVKNVSDSKKTKVWIRISKDNYEPWFSGEIQATISPAKIANLPLDPQIFVPWTCKKVADITTNLPTNWNWQDSSKYLQLGSNSVIAVYNGSDAGKGNYERETVTYTITRSKCTHEHTAGRYYSSPSCTSSGYSGDTYCKDCNETISYGYTISAYGHDYDSGVITTEPTAETDGIITYTCKRCKHQDTKTLGKLGDGEPYIEGSFQKKGWDAVNDLIKASKEKDTISITLNGSRTLPASVLSEIKGKDISLNLDMENGFIWKINGTSITAETPADIDLSVTNTAEYIPAALYSLISTNQNDFGFHLGRSGAFDFPAVLSVKADASCAGLMANLFWYDVENGVLQCIQTVTVGGAFERSIPYADFTLSKGQDYFIAFGTESLNGRVIHTDGSITDENGAYLRPANTKISSHSIDRNKLTVKLSKGCAGAQGYDFVISKKSNMLQTCKFSKTVSSTGKPQASFRYLAKGTWYVAARSWVLDEQGNKVYGSWTKIKKIKITVVTPQQPKIRNITVEGNTVTVTYTKCKNATGYEILLGNKYKTSAGEKYPVKKYVKRTEGKNTVTVTFTNVKKGTWYVTVRSWNKTSKNKSRVYSPYSDIKKFKVKK